MTRNEFITQYMLYAATTHRSIDSDLDIARSVADALEADGTAPWKNNEPKSACCRCAASCCCAESAASQCGKPAKWSLRGVTRMAVRTLCDAHLHTVLLQSRPLQSILTPADYQQCDFIG